MKVIRFFNKLVATLIVMTLVACSAGKEANYNEMAALTTEAVAPTSQAADEVTKFYSLDMNDRAEQDLVAKNMLHFSFDSSDLTANDLELLAAHAKYLLSHPEKKMRIAGHTDEQGSKNYNLVLGEKRAKAVANILMLNGVPSNQISTVSYGQEMPFILTHDEKAWAMNRRAELAYLG